MIRNYSKYIVSFLLIYSSSVVSSQENLEDSIFDAHHIKQPSKFLYEQYKRNQILFLGTANHQLYRHFNHLRDLLTLIGDDPNLKYIVFERSHDISRFYEYLSTETLKESLRLFEFQSERTKINSLCISPEWAFTIGDFSPWLRKLNKNLRPENPILIKSVDSISSSIGPPTEDEPLIPIKDGTCKASSLGIRSGRARESALIMTGATREKETAKNFTHEIWKELKSNEKAIVIYHYAHLIDFEGCMPELDEDGNWITNIVSTNWLRYFLNANSSARSSHSVIVMDEKDKAYNKNGVFKLTQRQFKRHPYSFAIGLAPFKGFLNEVGLNVFEDKAWWTQRMSPPSSARTLDQLVDGIIWNAEPYEDYMFKESHVYLPEVCNTLKQHANP
jgi:hypothetical protein